MFAPRNRPFVDKSLSPAMTDLSVHANLGLLPERKRPLSVFITSYGVQAVAVFLLVEFCVFAPIQVETSRKIYAYMAVSTEATPSAHPAHPKPQLKKPAAIEAARVRTPEPVHRLQAPELAKVAFAAPAPVLPHVTPKPIAPVVTGSFSSGSSATPTVKAPVTQVQTGGFGDPNGLPAKGDGHGQLIAAKVGSFDLPEGAGQGNGAGGARGIRGTVASAGFGNGVATQAPGSGGPRSIQQGGFGDTRQAEPQRVQRVAEPQGPTTPVEIISKPKPVYTDEARQLKLEGEVLVEVVFTSSGQVRAIRVVKGLGHGLDEAALRAAEQIRFKPAQRDGRAVDSTAILHVVFQIA